ncbi:MAG: Sec-independent protein translocase protein TatB [Steroidobacteraceae bacterium]
MLDFGFSEILLTSAIALVVLGPERLPKVARRVGNWMGRARLMARQLSEQLEREVNAEELLREQTKPDSRVSQPPLSPSPIAVPAPAAPAPAAPAPAASPSPLAQVPSAPPAAHAPEQSATIDPQQTTQ